MNNLWHDIVFGIRVLARKPLFTAAIALSLAVGIGLNTAIFTLMNSILLQSLPFPDADRVVTLSTIPPGHPDQPNGVSVPELFAWQTQSHSFAAMGALRNNAVDFGPEENGVPAERIQGEFVTPGLLRALGAKPMMGRLIAESEDEVDHPAAVIVISYRLWMRRFGGAGDIVNRKVMVNRQSTTIIGVMPPDFRITDENGEYLAPLQLNHFQLRGSARYLTVAARLNPGVSLRQAQQEMDAISGQLARQFPARETDHGRPWTVRIRSFRDGIFGFMERPLLLLQCAVAFVLLIACANVAALLMARASSRQAEVAIRAALGAGRARLFRQFLTESLLLSLLGGAAGVWLAWSIVRGLVAMAPAWLPMLHAIRIDSRVLLFSAAISLLTGLIFGVIPAARGSKAGWIESLKTAGRGGTPGASRHRFRAMMVGGQLALALMLLIASGLLIRGFLQLQRADLGCDPHGLLTFRYRFPENRFARPVGTYHGLPQWELSDVPPAAIMRVFERLKTLPGLHSVGGTVYPPLTGDNPVPFTIEGRVAPNADELTADYYPVTPGFFNTMKAAIVRGRDFNDRDTPQAPWAAIVNQTMARRFFPNEDPIGRQIHVYLSDEDQPREIVAVVRDIPASHPQTRQDPAIFVPFAQQAARSTGPYTGLHLQMTFLMRTDGDPMKALPAVRRAVEEVDRSQPLIDPRTEDSYLAEQAQYPRYYSMLLGLFAAVATGLAAVGIYGVMAYAVEQRTREIGIRMALGARGLHVLQLIFRQALAVIAGGLVLGLVGAAGLTRFISSEIWEVKTKDTGTFAGLAVLLAAIALLACLAPTRRAVRVDPMDALRHE